MDVRILASRPLGERLAAAVGARVYPTRGPRDDVRVYVARATGADLRALAVIADEAAPPYVGPPARADEVAAEREAGAGVAAMRHAHGDPSA